MLVTCGKCGGIMFRERSRERSRCNPAFPTFCSCAVLEGIFPVQAHLFKAADSRAQKTQQLFENTRHFSKICHNPTRVNLSGAAGCIREALGSLRSAVSGNFCKQYATDVPFTPLALVSHSSLQ